MSFKTILAPMLFEDTARIVAEAAMVIAGAERGHVIGKHIRQIQYHYPPMAYSTMLAVPPRGFDQALREASRVFAEAQKALFDEICDEAGAHRVSLAEAPRKRGRTASWSDETGNVPESLGRAARVCDLSIAAIPGKQGGGKQIDIIENLLVSSGKPVLLVPDSGLSAYPESVMICWDGSRSAARAMDAALPFLNAARAIRLLTLKNVDADTPELEEAAAFLGMHGLTPKTELIAKPKGGIAKRILDEAKNSNTDVIVMGGYSHRRLDEAIFGGVTRYMLNRSDRALLMAH